MVAIHWIFNSSAFFCVRVDLRICPSVEIRACLQTRSFTLTAGRSVTVFRKTQESSDAVRVCRIVCRHALVPPRAPHCQNYQVVLSKTMPPFSGSLLTDQRSLYFIIT